MQRTNIWRVHWYLKNRKRRMSQSHFAQDCYVFVAYTYKRNLGRLSFLAIYAYIHTHSLSLKMQPKYMPSSANLLLPNNHIGATLFFTQCLIVLFSYSSSYAPLFCRKTRYLTTYLGVWILLCCRNRHVYAYIYKKNTSPQKMALMQ